MNDSAIQKNIIAKNMMISRHDIENIQQATAWHLEPGSSLIWIHEYSFEDVKDTQFSLQFFLSENSSLHYIPIIHGEYNLELDITFCLEQNSHAIIAGVYSLKNKQQYTIQTRQHHCAKNATSILNFNGIAADQSFISYKGTISVEKNAGNTNASQENKTILWGSSARALSIPALEVKTNEVQCAHGSAIGPLNKDYIHYMQSRGLSSKEAQRLLLTGFFAETLATLKDEELKMRIITKLIAHALDTQGDI